MTATLIQSPDEHHWMLLDHRVTQLAFDASSVRIHTWSLDASAEVRVDAPFTLSQPSGARRAFDPTASESLGPVLALLRRRVESVTVSRDGALTLAFAGGASLVVEPHARLDAWEVQGGGTLEGVGYRCPVGGGAMW
jgi:hypothetical protein